MGDFWFYGLGVVAKIVLGVLCGVVPLIYGAVKGQPRRGLIALLLCIVAGFFCGLFLAPFVSAYYVWRIYKSREDEVDDDMEESGLMSLNLNSKSVDKGVDKES